MSPPFEPVFSGRSLRAALHPGTSRRNLLVITFDFRRTTRKGFSDLAFSSSFARQGHAQLSISCRQNDWFINDETDALEKVLAPLAARFSEARALGYSMGGYGAFRFARALGLSGVIAVSPQSTIVPGAVRGDRRYAAEAQGFDPVLGNLQSRGRRDLPGLILVDPFNRLDLEHARRITRAFPQVQIVALPFTGHPASKGLGEAGRGWLLQREAVAEIQTGAAIRTAWREARRASARYWTNFAKTAQNRHPEWSALASDRAAVCAARDNAAKAEARAVQIENTRRNAERRGTGTARGKAG